MIATHADGVDAAPGIRSTAGFCVAGVQAVEEFPDLSLGPEHVEDHVPTVPGNDLVCVLWL